VYSAGFIPLAGDLMGTYNNYNTVGEQNQWEKSPMFQKLRLFDIIIKLRLSGEHSTYLNLAVRGAGFIDRRGFSW
jgi:hypothetical protein